jgi:hypothetical protein
MNTRWFEDISSATDRDRLRGVLETPGAKLVGPPVNIVIGLPARLSVWQTNMSVVYGVRPCEVTEACLRLGQYILRVYPRAADPATCLVRAVLNEDLLRARTTVLADSLRKYHRAATTVTSTLAFKSNFTRPKEPSPVKPELTIAGPKTAKMELDPETFPWPETHNTSWPQPMPIDIVQWLWTTAEARATPPRDLITECIATAAWLDANFTTAQTALREALLAKVVALDHLGQELGQILSALETWSADWPQVSEQYFQRFSKYLTPKEES